MRYLMTIIVGGFVVGGCASNPRRVFLDSTVGSDDRPKWAKTTKTAWQERDMVFLKTSHTVRGDERTNGCFDLAKLDAKEKLLSEIANDVRGSIDNAQQSISENAEVVLGKVRSGEFEGRIIGLRSTEEYFERYRVEGTERIDCFVLSEIKSADYEQVKRSVVNKIAAIDPKIKEAITNKQVNFFSREPASTETK